LTDGCGWRIIAGMKWDRLKGKFIVLDGPDGSGKSTQVQLLTGFIRGQGLTCQAVRDPGGTRIGDQIREILLNKDNIEMSVRCEALLFMASRAQLFSEQIQPALEQQKCVICDRWVSSTYAYQAVAGKIGLELVINLADVALERVWPDLTIIIDVPCDTGLARIGRIDKNGNKPSQKNTPAPNQGMFEFYATSDRMEEKRKDFHQRVRKAFLSLADTREDFRVVDGSGSIEEVHEEICEVIGEYVNS